MESYIITITDPALIAGITAAREAYNASLPAPEPVEVPEGEEAPEPEPVPTIDTNDDYVQFVMSRAAESYAKQYNTQE